MLDCHISLVPLLVVALGNFFLSWLYYSPAVPWFRSWARAVGVDPDKREMTEEDRRAMPRLMGGAVVGTFLFSSVLQLLVRNVKATSFVEGALVGLCIWLGFVVTHSLNTQFEGRKPTLLIIENGLYLLSYPLFGGLVAVLS